jgi:hypothetical protein
VVEPNRLRTEARPNTLAAGATGVSPNANILAAPPARVARDGATVGRAPSATAGTARPSSGARRRTWRRGLVLSLLAAASGVVLIFTDQLRLIELGIALVLGGLGFAIVSSLLDAAPRGGRGSSLRALASDRAPATRAPRWIVALGMIALGLLFFVTAIDRQ